MFIIIGDVHQFILSMTTFTSLRIEEKLCTVHRQGLGYFLGIVKFLQEYVLERERGDIGLFITLVPKVLYYRFLICLHYINFGNFSKF